MSKQQYGPQKHIQSPRILDIVCMHKIDTFKVIKDENFHLGPI